MQIGIHNGIPPLKKDILETTIYNILRNYNAQMWLPGPSDVAGNYEDGTGALPMTSVNGIVGCVADETSSGVGENLCANSEFVGAALGTVAPTGIGFSSGNGITLSCVGFGTDSFGSYMDVRWQGTAAATTYPGVSLLPGGIIPAVPFELCSAGCFIELLSGTPPSTATLLMNGYTAGVAYVQQANSAQISGPRAYYTARKVFDNATVANCGAIIQLSCPISSIVNVTMRIWKPQVNRGVLMPYLPTTGTRVINPYSNIGLNSLTTANKPTLYGGCTSVISNGFDLNASSWSVTNGTRIAGSQYGTSRSAILVGDSTAGQHYFSNSSPTPVKDNTTYYACIQAKSISGNPLFRLQCRKKDGSVCYMNVDLDSGLLFNAPTGVLSADVVRKEGGFWQLRMSFNSATGASGPNLVALLLKGDSVSAEGTSIEMMNFYLSDSPAIYDMNPVLMAHYLTVPVVPYSWKFDGTADSLQIAKVNVNPAADHFMICCFKMPPVTISAARAVAGYGNSGVQERLQLIFLSSNVINCFWRDAAGVAVSILSGQPARAVNEKLCITMRKKAGQLYGSVKGSITAPAAGTTADPTAAWTPTLGYVGGSVSTGAFAFQWEDEIYGVITGSGAPTDAELLVMENFLIGCAGFTPVP